MHSYNIIINFDRLTKITTLTQTPIILNYYCSLLVLYNIIQTKRMQEYCYFFKYITEGYPYFLFFKKIIRFSKGNQQQNYVQLKTNIFFNN